MKIGAIRCFHAEEIRRSRRKTSGSREETARNSFDSEERNYFFSSFRIVMTAMRPELMAKAEAVPSPTFRS